MISEFLPHKAMTAHIHHMIMAPLCMIHTVILPYKSQIMKKKEECIKIKGINLIKENLMHSQDIKLIEEVLHKIEIRI
jgi:hypothetical protein